MDKFGRDYFYGKKMSNYNNYEELNPSKYFKGIISFIKTRKIQGKFLDIGCAFGLLMKELSGFPLELYGCDISRFAILKAQKAIPKADLQIVDLEAGLPYSDGFFDCITALDVLEHTENFEDNFGKIVKKLKSGGYFIVSVPIHAWPRKLFGFLDKDITHISVLQEKEIIRIVGKHGLEIVSKKYFVPFPVFSKLPHIPGEIEIILKK